MRLIEGTTYGIHHMAAAGTCSWYDFAREIFDQAKVECKVLSATTDMLGRPAPRPARSALVSERQHAIELPSWQDGLAGYLAQRQAERQAAAMRLLVAGGAGFIGSTYVRHHVEAHPDDTVRVLDKLTYAGRRENLASTAPSWSSPTIRGPERARGGPRADAIVNFAAESHVDRSIHGASEFIETDVFGTYVLLEAARDAGLRHLQVSTDEVYGSIEAGSFTETSPLDPSSPYSATKAAGDLLVSAHAHTYGTEALICRGSNNYGPRQHPEKLIPLTILNCLAGDSVPVYGDGRQVRNWLFVEDFAAASTPCWRRAGRARPTTSAAPTRARTSTS